MSKAAWLFLCLTVVTAVLGMSTSSQDARTAALLTSVVFGSFLLLTLIVGRRIRFDPVLR